MNERRFYDKQWFELKGWKKEGSNYLKMKPSIEGIVGVEWISKMKREGRVLDIGCGGGRNSILFAKKGYEVVGIDFSKEAIKLAKINAEKNNAKIEFLVKDFLEYMPNKKFDIVLDFGMFHHVRKYDWKRYREALNRSLKRGGLYLLYCFSTKSKPTKCWNPRSNRRWCLRKGHYSRFFSLDEIEGIFKEFKRIKSKIIEEKGRLLRFNLVLMQRL